MRKVKSVNGVFAIGECTKISTLKPACDYLI